MHSNKQLVMRNLLSKIAAQGTAGRIAPELEHVGHLVEQNRIICGGVIAKIIFRHSNNFCILDLDWPFKVKI